MTGTKDKDYDIIWFTEACLDKGRRGLRLAEFLRKAQGDTRKGAEQGKQLLAKRLRAA